MTAPTTQSPHFVEGMSFTPDRLDGRRVTLGASEIAAVAGLDQYRSPLDVYLQKIGKAPPFEGNQFTEWGLRLEEVIAKKYGEFMGVQLFRSETMIMAGEPWVCATPDRMVKAKGNLVGPPAERWGLECKNKGFRQRSKFGEIGTDHVPDDLAAQCHWSMLVTDMPWWDIAVLFGGCEFAWFRIQRDTEIASALLEKGREFWFKHVLAGVEPPVDASQTWTDYIRSKFRRYSDELRQATMDEDRWLRDLRTLRGRKGQLEVEEQLLENRLKNSIGESAGIIAPAGRVTWKAPVSGPVRWKEVATVLNAPPELITQHTSDPERRFCVAFPKENL